MVSTWWQWPRGALLFREHLFYASIQLAADWRALAASQSLPRSLSTRPGFTCDQISLVQIFEFHFDCGGSRTPFARKMRRLLARPIMANDSCCSWVTTSGAAG